jgi:hypothetical protein
MPRRDGTGPMGRRCASGRGKGPCAENQVQEIMPSGAGRGSGQGQGPGDGPGLGGRRRRRRGGAAAAGSTTRTPEVASAPGTEEGSLKDHVGELKPEMALLEQGIRPLKVETGKE